LRKSVGNSPPTTAAVRKGAATQLAFEAMLAQLNVPLALAVTFS